MNANLLHPNPVLASQFTWLPDQRLYVAEASDLGSRDPFGRVYKDAVDVGLTLVSRHTGAELVLVVNHEERDSDGDVQYWDLVPADLRERQRQQFTVRVYND